MRQHTNANTIYDDLKRNYDNLRMQKKTYANTRTHRQTRFPIEVKKTRCKKEGTKTRRRNIGGTQCKEHLRLIKHRCCEYSSPENGDFYLIPGVIVAVVNFFSCAMRNLLKIVCVAIANCFSSSFYFILFFFYCFQCFFDWLNGALNLYRIANALDPICVRNIGQFDCQS